jgi:hypothetical protein
MPSVCRCPVVYLRWSCRRHCARTIQAVTIHACIYLHCASKPAFLSPRAKSRGLAETGRCIISEARCLDGAALRSSENAPDGPPRRSCVPARPRTSGDARPTKSVSFSSSSGGPKARGRLLRNKPGCAYSCHPERSRGVWPRLKEASYSVPDVSTALRSARHDTRARRPFTILFLPGTNRPAAGRLDMTNGTASPRACRAMPMPLSFQQSVGSTVASEVVARRNMRSIV